MLKKFMHDNNLTWMDVFIILGFSMNALQCAAFFVYLIYKLRH